MQLCTITKSPKFITLGCLGMYTKKTCTCMYIKSRKGTYVTFRKLFRNEIGSIVFRRWPRWIFRFVPIQHPTVMQWLGKCRASVADLCSLPTRTKIPQGLLELPIPSDLNHLEQQMLTCNGGVCNTFLLFWKWPATRPGNRIDAMEQAVETPCDISQHAICRFVLI